MEICSFWGAGEVAVTLRKAWKNHQKHVQNAGENVQDFAENQEKMHKHDQTNEFKNK